MMEPRRINLRVDEELFKRLNDKRHAEDTTFQRVGIRLLQEWLADPDAGQPESRPLAEMSPDEAAVVTRILAVLRSGNADAIKGLYAALEIGELLIEAVGKGKRK